MTDGIVAQARGVSAQKRHWRSLRGWIALAVVAGTAGCTSVSQETRVPTTLAASEFNEVASRYMERPTQVSLQTMSDGATILFMELDTYGTGYDPTTGVTMPYTLAFDQRHIDSYIALIDKYFEWEKVALERGDAIDRELGTAAAWSQTGGGKLNFGFYSGNTDSHFLEIDFCLMTCGDQPFYFNHANAVELRRLLVELKGGRLQQTDVDAVYK